MNYDIVIATYKREQMLRTLLASIPKGIADIYIYFDGEDKETWEKFKDNKDYISVLFEYHVPNALTVFNHHNRISRKRGIVCLNDDMELMPKALENLIECFENRFPDTDGIVGMCQFEIPSGCQCAAWIAGDKFISRFENRDILYPEYHGRFPDTELQTVAQILGKWQHCGSAQIKHWHPESGVEVIPDEARIEAGKFLEQDRAIYLERLKNRKFMDRVNKEN